MLNLLKHFRAHKNEHEVFFAYQGIGAPKWTPCNYNALSDEGFCKNVIAFRAISLIARSIASIPIKIKEGGDANKHHHLEKLLKRPNSRQGKAAFIESLVSYLLISGNAFIYSDKNSDIYCLRPDRLQIIPNESNTSVEYYNYTVDSSAFSIPNDDILHLRFFNPLNDWYGFSPLQAASKSIDQFNEMSNHNLALLQNGGRPSGCLCVNGGMENLTDEQRDQLRSDIKNAYVGSTNAGKVMILEGNFEWKEMGLSPKDLDFNAGKNMSAREIAQAYGVPAMLVGLQGDSSYANYKEARMHLWEDTILPLAEYIKLEFNNWLSKTIGDVEIMFELDLVHALSSRREGLWGKISNASFLTINEKREMLGYGPLNNKDLQELTNK